MKKLLLLSVIILCSCASRKVSTDITKTETKTDVTEALKEKTTSNTEKKKESTEIDKTTVKTDVIETEEDVKPIDASKPVTKTVTKDGNTTKTVWENANVTTIAKTDKSVSEKQTYKKETAKEKSEAKTKSESKTDKKESVKSKEKTKETEVISLWWLLLLLIIPFGYWVYKTK